MNMPTSLDYTLQFVLQFRHIWIQQQPQQLTLNGDGSTSVSSGMIDQSSTTTTVTRPQIDPMHLVNLCLPCLHYAQINYKTSLCRQASIAVASVCFIIQDITEQDTKKAFLTEDNKKALEQQISIYKTLRNEWLQCLQNNYGELLDFKEIFSIVEYLLTVATEEAAQQEAQKFVQQIPNNEQEKLARKPWHYSPEDLDEEEIKADIPMTNMMARAASPRFPNIGALNLNSPVRSSNTDQGNMSASREPFKGSNQIIQKYGPDDQSSEEEESSHYSGKGERKKPRRAAKPERVNKAISKKAKSPTSEMTTITKRIKSPNKQ